MPQENASRLGLYLNIPRVKARRTLENMVAIGLAMAGDPADVGQLRVMAGEDIREVGKWVQKATIDKREKEIESRHHHGS